MWVTKVVVIWVSGMSETKSLEVYFVVVGAEIAAAAAAFAARFGETGQAVEQRPWLVSPVISRMSSELGYGWEMVSVDSTADKRTGLFAVQSLLERVHRRNGSVGLIRRRYRGSALDSLEAVRDTSNKWKERVCMHGGTDYSACGLDTVLIAAVVRCPSA